MNNPLISIIVPIYKVEQYLYECIKSLINQTYNNIEIILVDDGSPDSCPVLCDEWAKKDSRIRVIHKQNGGLSSARNAGLEAANGEYIGFIDSDDFIAKNMFETLYQGFSLADKVGIVSCCILKYKDGSCYDFNPQWNPISPIQIQHTEFARTLLLEKGNFTCWSKLYRKDVIKNVRFRVGRNNEDALFMFELAQNVESGFFCMIQIPDKLYYYRVREDSICTTSKVPLQIDLLKNCEEMIEFYKTRDKYFAGELVVFYNCRLMAFMEKIIANEDWYKKYYNEYSKKIREINFWNHVRYTDKKIMSLRIPLMKYFPRAYSFFNWLK